MIAYFVLRLFVYPMLAVSFPHWNDWSVANAGDVVCGLLVQIGVAVPVVFISLRVFNLVGRLISSLW